ncbi:MAG TPA: porin [Bacillota bacterium]|nr:porin [Bacillota bacterium]
MNTAYYYGKGLLSDNDELDIGYIKLPFYNSTYNALFVGSLSYNARPQNSVGISYSGKLNTFTYALAVANAANKANYNSPTVTEGVDLTLRLGYTPIDPLQIGLGYSKDKANNNNTTDLSVLDAAYTIGAFRIYAEYVGLTPEAKDDLSGAYFEGSYQVVKPVLVYAGRAVNISDGGNNGQQLIQYINSKTGINISGGPRGNNFSLSDNWTLFGVKYQIGPQVTLQGEFLQQDSPKAKQIFGLRSSIKF